MGAKAPPAPLPQLRPPASHEMKLYDISDQTKKGEFDILFDEYLIQQSCFFNYYT